MTAGAQARLYLRRRHHGVLSTLSRKFPGYPFGSVVPYVLDHKAWPVILISRLAEHTGNIDSDGRVSLLVNDGRDDVQASARLTLIGDAARVDRDLAALRERYLNYFPDAGRLLALGDFAFYRIEPRRARFIGGFGSVRWVTAKSYEAPANTLAGHERDLLFRVNAEHAQGLRDCCHRHHRRRVAAATLIGIDCDGFDVRADGEILRFDFGKSVTDARQARRALAEMARRGAA